LTSTSKDYTAYTRGADQLRVAEVATPKLEAPEQNGIELCPTDAADGTLSGKTEEDRTRFSAVLPEPDFFLVNCALELFSRCPGADFFLANCAGPFLAKPPIPF
jgi:hypothetical protein